VPDLIHLQPNRFYHIVANQFKTWAVEPLGQIFTAARLKVINTDHLSVAILHQEVDEMGTDESRSSCNKMAHGSRSAYSLRIY
jgi:hypothetical protein